MTLFAFFASVAFADNQAPTPPTATVERWHSDPLGCGLRVTGPQALVTRTEAARGGRSCVWYVHLPDAEQMAISLGRIDGLDGQATVRVIEADGRSAGTLQASTVMPNLRTTVILEVETDAPRAATGLFVTVHSSR